MRGVDWDTASTVERDGWNARLLHLYSHAGTHMDAPVHYNVSDTAIDDISLDRCVVQAWVVDCGEPEPKSLLTVEHLGGMQNCIQTGDGVLLRTGWSRRHGTPAWRDELPRVSDGLAIWLAERKIGLLGVEAPAVADVHNIEEITRIHTILLQAGIVIVEGLTNLEALTQQRVTFMALPLKIAGGDGAPVRALAIEENE